jgi:2-polyprenyl-3-methyl-5-hydroxy-6-metoxy-1,4-benzoquinol methylase
MYQIFHAKDGSKQHVINSCSHIQYWNDACWHRCIPNDTNGLSYLDVGSHAGYFCLRFEQRGGKSLGLDFCMAKITDAASEVSNVGFEQDNLEYLWVKKEFNPDYKVLVGGFDRDGKIVPDCGKFNIISTMNVLEYLPNPKLCVKELFNLSTDRVILNLDINPTGKTREITDLFPMKWLCGLKDVLSWIPWPYVYWIYDIGDSSHSKYQLFLSATHPNSILEKVDGSKILFDCVLSETEKFYRCKI